MQSFVDRFSGGLFPIRHSAKTPTAVLHHPGSGVVPGVLVARSSLFICVSRFTVSLTHPLSGDGNCVLHFDSFAGKSNLNFESKLQTFPVRQEVILPYFPRGTPPFLLGEDAPFPHVTPALSEQHRVPEWLLFSSLNA